MTGEDYVCFFAFGVPNGWYNGICLEKNDDNKIFKIVFGDNKKTPWSIQDKRFVASRKT